MSKKLINLKDYVSSLTYNTAVSLGYWNIPVNLDDALRWYGKRIDKEIGIMSARSAQRTRWRRWRMGRDIAGRKDRDGRMSGSQAQLVGGDHALRIGGQLLLLLCIILISSYMYPIAR